MIRKLKYTTSSKRGMKHGENVKFLEVYSTQKDINRRTKLAIDTYKTLKKILNSKKNFIKIKLRTFNAYVKSVFLYNSELWTLTKKQENSIDTFQRRHLRKILGMKWQRNITNHKLYNRTKCEPWTKQIKIIRLMWLGHMMRLHPETPARNTFEEYLRKVKRPQGRPKTTWM